ncbi:uncharacterized protein LOC111400204 [Olea europaea var. sylvestris]|uniref:uncharacterized protein LOC111400204 n=1 Tax=Olea europaea var. sylvestris TaxID=158386 RepID=UPI000C1D02EB|nr:uncharacterized protein LOC111400204 [Olea europaea var. sylvestris]
MGVYCASLKAAIDQLFSTHSLSISNLRGQGYDGASNMRCEYNGLKALILKENPSAYHIHCFAHQLQLALIAVAQKHPKIETFFTTVHRLVNIVGGSTKRSDLIRENQTLKILESLSIGEISSGRGLNQEITIQRPSDTRWGSHYSCLINLIAMFSTIVDVIKIIATDFTSTRTRGRSRLEIVTNLHHFHVEMFYAVIDMQLQELNDHFSEVNSDLLICVACLSPNNSFAAFDKIKLIRLCQYYPLDFDAVDILELNDQLDTYILYMCTSEDFEELQDISDLAQKLVVKNKHEVYPLVYKLVTLTSVLLVTTATVERAFSTMTYVKKLSAQSNWRSMAKLLFPFSDMPICMKVILCSQLRKHSLFIGLIEFLEEKRTIVLPKARYEWMYLCLQDFKTVTNGTTLSEANIISRKGRGCECGRGRGHGFGCGHGSIHDG